MFTKADLKQLLADGKIKQTIKAMLEIARSMGDNELLNDVTLQSGRFEQAEREKIQGVTDPNDLRRQLAQINHALLSLIDELPQDVPITTAPPPTATGTGIGTSTTTVTGIGGTPIYTGTGDGGGHSSTGTGDGHKPANPTAWIVGLILLVGMVLLLVFVPCPTEAQFFAFRLALALAAGGLATLLPGMFGLDLKTGVKAGGALGFVVLVYATNPASLVATASDKCNNEPFNFTVRLQPTRPAGYPRLAEGNLKIWIVNRYEKPELNSDLMAEVKGVPASSEGNRVDVSLEGAAHWKLSVDSITLSKTSQTLEAVPDGSLGELSGKVRSEKGAVPLEGVIVEIEEVKDTTDAQGNFHLIIPDERQKGEYQLFAKKGSSSLTKTVYAGTNLDIRLKK